LKQPLATERINTVDIISSVADPNFLDADPDPDPACHFNADPFPNPSFLIKAQYLEKVLKFPYILACHLQIDDIRIQLITFMRMRIRILPFNLMRIHADPDSDAQHQ
jgi:hypothetical protein